MPTISAPDAATLRQFPQGVRRYLSPAPRVAVFAARVSSGTIQRDAVTGGVIAIPYDTVTLGAYTGVIVGMTLDIGTTAGGAEIGKVRVRSANAAQILIGEPPLALAAGNYLTARYEFRLWQVKPRRYEDTTDAAYPTSFTEFHDYDVVYSNQNMAIPPKANITAGGLSHVKPAGFVDVGQDYRTVTLSSADSITLAHGAAISSRVWNVADGTIITGTTGSTQITVRFPVGFRYVTLTVTDSNGASSLMRLPIWTHDADNMPLTEFTVTRDETRAGGGREMRFEIFGQADASLLPEGSAICYWEDADFGGDNAPSGYRGQFLGWATRDATLFRLYRSRYSLDVAGAAGWLERFGGFAQTLIDPGRTPTQWHEMQRLTLDRAAHYALRAYTNALSLVNFYTSTVSDEAQTITLGRGSAWGQLVELVRGYCGTAGCDTLGGIWLREHLSYQSAATQAGATPVISLTNADWTDAEGLVVQQEKSEAVGLVEASGATYIGGVLTLLASRARGKGGVGRTTLPFQVVASQDALNARAGRHLARLNNPRPRVRLRLLDNLDAVEPCWNEPIALSSVGENVRGLVLNNARFLLMRVSAEHSNQPGVPAKMVTWTLEATTSGESGITLDVPAKTVTAPRAPRASRGKKTKPLLLSPGMTTIAAPNEDGYVYLTRNFTASSPTWTRYAISGMSGKLLDFVPDPFSPQYLGTGTAVNGWLVTENEIGHLADIFGTSPTYTVQHTFAAAVVSGDGQRLIETERSTQNFVVVVSYYPASGTKAIISTNGTTWGSETTLTSHVGGAYLSPGLVVSGKAANTAYTAAVVVAGTSFQGYRYSGGSWGAISDPDISGLRLPGWMHIPWHDNDDSLIYYGAINPDKVFKAKGTTRTEITPVVSGNAYTCRYPRSLDTCAINRQRVVLTALNDPAGPVNRNAVFVSKDGGTTWKTVYGPVSQTIADYLSVRCAGDDEDVFYVFGPQGKIGYSADFGETPLQNKRGNLGSFAGISKFVNLCGG